MPRAAKSGPSIRDLEQAFRKRKFDPIYLFHGEEDFLIDEMVNAIVRYGVEESTRGFNLDVIQGSTSDGNQVVAVASAFPMMAETRVVVVHEVDRLQNREALLPYIENALPSTVLVLVSAKPDFRQKVFQALREHATVVECKQLYENEIPEWLIKQAEARGKRITADAVQMIQSYVGRSLREIDNEVEKLAIYVGASPEIKVEDVNDVVGMTKQYNIFELQRAIGRKDITRSLDIAAHMLDAGEHMTGMVVMLTRYFQRVWLLQENHRRGQPGQEAASLLGVSPFFAKEYADAARFYSAKQVEGAFAALQAMDEAIKSTNPDPKLTLTLLLHRIMLEPESATAPRVA